MPSAIAGHYARALADAVFAPGSDLNPADAVEQVKTAAALLASSEELRRVLLSPAISRVKKTALIGRLGDDYGLHRLVRNFLRVIVGHRQTQHLTEILADFEAVVDDRLGFIRAEIVSATELSDAQKHEIEGALESTSKQHIRASYKTDSSILGGIIARVGSKEYDGSLLGRLEAMRQRLTTAS